MKPVIPDAQRRRPPFYITDDMGRAFEIARTDTEACMVESDTPEGWTCSRPKGHPPDLHVACTFHEERRGHPPDCVVWQWTPTASERLGIVWVRLREPVTTEAEAVAYWWTDVVDVVHARGDAIRAAYAAIDPSPVCGLLAMACELARGDKKAGRAPIDLTTLPKNGAHHAE